MLTLSRRRVDFIKLRLRPRLLRLLHLRLLRGDSGYQVGRSLGSTRLRLPPGGLSDRRRRLGSTRLRLLRGGMSDGRRRLGSTLLRLPRGGMSDRRRPLGSTRGLGGRFQLLRSLGELGLG